MKMADDKYLKKFKGIVQKNKKEIPENIPKYKAPTPKEKYLEAYRSNQKTTYHRRPEENARRARDILEIRGYGLYSGDKVKEDKFKNEVAILANELMSQPGGAFLGAQLYEKIGLANKPSVKNRLLKQLDKYYEELPPSTIRGIKNFLEKHSDKKTGNLEKTVQIISSLFLISSIFFLSPISTGNAVGNLAKSNSIGVGVILFILGIVGLFFHKK